MKAVKVADNIYWVGAIDWNIRNFHGYLTQKGTTYNAYLILDEKITLIDTVKSCFFDEMLARIRDVVDPAKIEYIVSNHVEMDHSGSIPSLMKIAVNASIITSVNGEKGLMAHYEKYYKDSKAAEGCWNFITVQSGDKLVLGRNTLEFLHTPMVHWPDNMVSFLREAGVLFSNDAFGQHIATSERFVDELAFDIAMKETAKYYANIALPYGRQVKNVLNAVSGMDIQIIAPSHGLIWRSGIKSVIDKYRKWSENEADNKAVIIYDTMWGSTEQIAYMIQSAFERKRIGTKMLSLKANHISDIMTHVLEAKYICVGSPTLNNGMMPDVAAFLCYLKGLAPKNRIGLAFGSYGWGGQSVGQVDEALRSMGFKMLDMIRIQYIPSEERLLNERQKLENELP